MSHRRVLRYEIPVDDQHHSIAYGPVLVAHSWRQAPAVPAGRVELWVEATVPDDWPQSDAEQTRQVQVFGTGHRIPEGALWVGSCLDGPLVWHVYAVSP